MKHCMKIFSQGAPKLPEVKMKSSKKGLCWNKWIWKAKSLSCCKHQSFPRPFDFLKDNLVKHIQCNRHKNWNWQGVIKITDVLEITKVGYPLVFENVGSYVILILSMGSGLCVWNINYLIWHSTYSSNYRWGMNHHFLNKIEDLIKQY